MTIATEELTECRSPYCHESPVTGRRFCTYHIGIFERVKESERDRRDAVRGTIKRKGARPTCCRPGCFEPRVAAEPFCDVCQAAGFEPDYD